MNLEGAGGTAKVLMGDSRPAFHIVRTHFRSADPKGFEPEVWTREPMPTVLNLEAEDRHSEANGFLL